jgi:hypothetical protein
MNSRTPYKFSRPVVIPPPYYKLLQVVCRNDESWYMIKCYRVPMIDWVHDQPKDQWLRIHGRLDEAGYEIDGKRYVVNKELFLMFSLRWG